MPKGAGHFADELDAAGITKYESVRLLNGTPEIILKKGEILTSGEQATVESIVSAFDATEDNVMEIETAKLDALGLTWTQMTVDQKLNYMALKAGIDITK